MTPERELVQLFGVKGRKLDALRGLAGGFTATHLRTASISDDAFDALIDGLSSPSARIRWWCVQVLDHVPGPRAASALVPAA